jgi:putative FmdB family regulatory protein
MPTYDYKCEACGFAFEKFHSISAKPIRKCPKCGKLKVRRLIGTGAGMIFKGSGFYITDYRSEGYKSAAKADNGGGGSTDKKDSSGSSGGSKESKPAAPVTPAAPKSTKTAESKK